MSKHTPGPWTACFSKACGVITGFHIAAQKHGSTVPVVEAEVRFAPSRSAVEIEANARLIAAAPEMLEALRLIADYAQEQITDLGAIIQEGGEWSDWGHANSRRWNLVLSAIAKAEGHE